MPNLYLITGGNVNATPKSLPKRGDELYIPSLTHDEYKIHVWQLDPFTHEYVVHWSTFGLANTTYHKLKAKWFKENPDKWCYWIERKSMLQDKKHCVHVWKDYKGFTEVYKYCTICDEKKF